MNVISHRVNTRMSSRSSVRRASIWVIAAILAGIAIVSSLFYRQAPQLHSYVVVQATESLRITFLQRIHPSRERCQETAKRIAQTMLAQCTSCRLVENRCLDQLDARQRKILSGQALDIPVMRIPGGAVAFMSDASDVATQACRESERQVSGKFGARCAAAGPDGIALSLAKVSGAADVKSMPKLNAMLWLVALAFSISLAVSFLIVRSERLHGRFSNDERGTGPQKFHAVPTPRIGGVAIGAGLAAGTLAIEALGWLNPASAYGLTMLALAAIPAFVGGFAEDITKKVGALARLMLTFAAGVFASLLAGATLDRLDIPVLDGLLQQWPFFAIAFTAFAVGGIANSINIIDGYNGLAGGYSVMVIAALAWVAAQVGDPVVLAASLTMLGALLGFLLLNYPRGSIFLGDGGAYLLGFWLAELSVLLVVRNPDVSPWFPLVLLAYPVIETLFSIYRKGYLRGTSPGRPDGLHLHMLIYKRLVRYAVRRRTRNRASNRNNLVALYVWAGTALIIVPSLFVWSSTFSLIALALTFVAAYVWLYSRLIRWRVPAWMTFTPKPVGRDS